MFRPPPPRGRVRRLLICAVLLCSTAIVAFPATASEEASEPPTEAEPLAVVGRDLLDLPLPVQSESLTVVVTVPGDEPARWNLETPPATDPPDATPYALDLDEPAIGAPPRNGVATLVVSTASTTLLATTLVVDRAPPVPGIAAGERAGDVLLVWNAAGAVGPVTYRLERAAAGEWAVRVGAGADSRYTDEGLDPGRYRYRLTSAVPGARGGRNYSAPAFVTVRVATEVATPPPTRNPEPQTSSPPAPQPQRVSPRVRRPARQVAVTGDIRGGVSVRRSAVHRGAANALTLQPLRWNPRLVTRTAAGPALAAPRLPRDNAPVTAPPLNGLVPEPPVTVPPSGTLAVEVGQTRSVTTSVSLQLTAAALAGIAMVAVRRRRTPLSLRAVDLR